MIFTAEEKKRIDNVMKAFGDYIREHKAFDIVYSNKVGYFRVWVPNMTYEGPKPLNSVDALLEELFFRKLGKRSCRTLAAKYRIGYDREKRVFYFSFYKTFRVHLK